MSGIDAIRIKREIEREIERQKEPMKDYISMRINIHDYDTIKHIIKRINNQFHEEDRYIEINVDNEYYPTTDDSGKNIDLLTILLSKDDIGREKKNS